MVGRPGKSNVDFFSHDADALHRSDTLRIIDGNYGNDGYALWFKLLERISGSDNCISDLRNSNTWQLFLLDVHLSEEKANQILDHLARLDAIDPQLWQARIVWCQKLVDRLSAVFKARAGGKLPQRPIYLLDNAISKPENSISTTDNSINKPHNAQSKVKESKVNKENILKEIPEWLNPETWLAFLDMRKKIKKPPTKRAMQLIISSLEKMKSSGYDPNSILEKSIISGWAGVYEPKGGNNGANRGHSRAGTELPKTYTEPPYDPALDKSD